MRFVVSSTDFLSHLQTIGRVISSKNTIPILDSFLFSLNENQLTITASDGDTTLVTTMQVADAEGNGVFAISAKLLLDPLRELPEQPLTLDINDANLEVFIYFQNGKYNLIGQHGEDYPKSPAIKEEHTQLNIEAQALASGINKTIFATADDELRPVMNGVFFDITPDALTFVASDSHKLVRCTNNTIKANSASSFILPKKPATMLKNILPKEQGAVSIAFDERLAHFTFSNYRMVCRLIEGRFPNYNSVIPQNNPYKVVVDRVQLMAALRRVSHFSNQASNLIKLQIENNLIVVTAQDIDFSTAAEESIMCQYGEAPIRIGFKSSFLVEILNNMGSSEVSLELADPSRAGIVLPMDQDENEDLLMLIMPMMLND
ncbi:DNA polymerase III subunit beta [Parabacteroides sp. FAFU027]|uniref:DNA polymerase III subunit beta n=1 Tax=Parabacteroides sp. FAFU027 TaxID=2922715 RepID=UPI001FAF6562|nr:DNA polymerase III subunit beta [Parabacteroides sp. FAFU027]